MTIIYLKFNKKIYLSYPRIEEVSSVPKSLEPQYLAKNRLESAPRAASNLESRLNGAPLIFLQAGAVILRFLLLIFAHDRP